MNAFARGLCVGVLWACASHAHGEDVLECTTVGRTTTCTTPKPIKSCQRQVLIAYGMSQPDQRERIEKVFPRQEIEAAQPLTDRFNELSATDASVLASRERYRCLAKE